MPVKKGHLVRAPHCSSAERETLRGLVSAVSGLMEGVSAMSKYEYLANLTEIATEIAQVKKVSADDIFKTLASLPRDKVSEQVKRML
jgi:hypothetical protein